MSSPLHLKRGQEERANKQSMRDNGVNKEVVERSRKLIRNRGRGETGTELVGRKKDQQENLSSKFWLNKGREQRALAPELEVEEHGGDPRRKYSRRVPRNAPGV